MTIRQADFNTTANQLLKSPAGKSGSTCQNKESARMNSLTTLVWKRLTDIYGHRFVSQHGPVGGEGFRTWCRELRGLSKEHIERGLRELEKRVELAFRNCTTVFPPSAIEFKAVCQPSSVAAAHRPFRPALPETKEARTERIKAGQHHINHLKAKLAE